MGRLLLCLIKLLSSDLQPAVQGDARPVLLLFVHANAIHHISLDEILQRPSQMLRRDAIHRRTQAAGLIQRLHMLTQRRKPLRQSIDQMYLRADSEPRTFRPALNDVDDALGRAQRVRLLANLPAALRMNDHLGLRALAPHSVYMLRQEALVHAAMDLPQNYLRGAQALRRDAAVELIRVPDRHLAQRNSQGEGRVSA